MGQSGVWRNQHLGQTLTPVPSSASLAWTAWSHSNDFTSADLKSLIGVAGAYPEVKRK